MKKWLVMNVPRHVRDHSVDVTGVAILVMLLCVIVFFILFVLWTLTTPTWGFGVVVLGLGAIIGGGTYAIKRCVDDAGGRSG